MDQVFATALSLPQEQRSAYLDRACAGDATLRRLIDELIEAEAVPDSFLARPILQAPDGPGQEGASSTFSHPADVSLEGRPRLLAGEVIANRFQVVRFIARGGMGEVYEVRDRLLQGSLVALKLIRSHIAADPYSTHRFEQEVLLARRVNHRHLCPIYDIFRSEESTPPFLFLTMKLLSGESLESRLKRRQGIPLDEGVRLCGQLMDGIHAIHSVGIVHRDIKPNNVMLEPQESGVCATIMDFGLARLSEAGATFSQVGQIAGTPGYLAPELMLGASPSAASDLYALGIVLHQILTGHRPAASRSGQPAGISVALEKAQVPAELIHAIREFLSEDPERRCRAFAERMQAGRGMGRSRGGLLTRRGFALGGAAAVGLLGTGSVWKRQDIHDYFVHLPTRRFVALLNWPPASDAKTTPLVLGIIDTMVNELSRAEAFDHDFFVACQSTVTEMKTPQQVSDVCDSLGANLILGASASVTADGTRLVLQVISKESGKVLRWRKLKVSPGQQFDLPAMATHAAAHMLNVADVTENVTASQGDTKNSEALSAFQAGEALLKEPNYKGLNAAIEEYKSAVDTDPHFANGHARLALAYFLHYEVNRDPVSLLLARANAETALNLDPDCSEAHSSLWAVYQATGDQTQALSEIAKALVQDPSNYRFATYQAQTYFVFGRWDEAANAFRRILKVRPNYWLAYNELANTYVCQGKFREALEAFQAASASSPRNAQPVAGTALIHFLLGDLDRSDAEVSKSLSLAQLPGPFQIRADILRVRNKFNESLHSALQAIDLDPEDGNSWLRVGDAYARMKHHENDARENYKRALAHVNEELQINPRDGSTWMLAALLQCKVDDRTRATMSLKRADGNGATDIFSRMLKVRILELLQRRDEALSMLALCVKLGATPILIRATNDLEALTEDVRSSSLVQSSI